MAEEVSELSKAWEILNTPPIEFPFLFSYGGYLFITVLTAYEMMSSTPPRPSALRQTPSPHTHPPNTENRGRATGIKGSTGEDGSPGSVEGGRYSNGSTSSNGRGKRDNRGKSNSTTVSYGAVPRNNRDRGAGISSDTRTGVSSSDDTVGSGSSGDNTRRSFYILLFLALLSRLCLFPFEAVFLGAFIPPYSPEIIFFRTLPDLTFFSAFSLLVLFYAQLAGTASGDGPRGLSVILQRPGYFRNGNIILYTSYFVLLSVTIFFPGTLPRKVFQSIVWLFLCVLYFLLLAVLTYFGPVLVALLRPSLSKRSGLALRLITMCVICILIFLSRSITFGLASFHFDINYTDRFIPSGLIKVSSVSDPTIFFRNAVGYVMLEVIPSFFILVMMHQNRPTPSFSHGGGDSTVRGGGRYAQIPSSSDVVDTSGRRVNATKQHGVNLIV